MDSKSILNEALRLRPAERLYLVELLTRSLNNPDEKIEKMWAGESEKRYKSLEDGKLRTIPLREIIKRYR